MGFLWWLDIHLSGRLPITVFVEVVMTYKATHRFFKVAFTSKKYSIWGYEELELIRQHLGDNNPNEVLQFRSWFTDIGGIWIRHDCLNNELVTWLALKES
jgi:hypothetical protein